MFAKNWITVFLQKVSEEQLEGWFLRLIAQRTKAPNDTEYKDGGKGIKQHISGSGLLARLKAVVRAVTPNKRQ
jgi:hypothetical protein